MGAVAYTSFGSGRDFYLAEKQREQNEISSRPEEEREKIKAIYAAKGFGGQLLDDVVSAITSNRETWVSTMMDEELHLQPVGSRTEADAPDYHAPGTDLAAHCALGDVSTFSSFHPPRIVVAVQ
jgi:hypothetical protein